MSSQPQEEEQRQRLAALELRAREFQQKYEEMIESFTAASLPLQRQAFECCVRCFDSCGIYGGKGGGGGGSGGDEQQTNSGTVSGWGRFLGRSAAGQAAADRSSPVSAACAAMEATEGRGEKLHDKLTRCVSDCQRRGEDVSRAIQQELDVLQSKVTSCQKGLVAAMQRTAQEYGPAASQREKLYLHV